MRRPLLPLSIAAMLACGCTSRAPVHTVSDAAPVAAPAIDPGPTAVESEIGGMSDFEVGRALEGLRADLDGCFGSGSARVAALGGHVKLQLRVARTGAVRSAYLSETTLGDRETEKCILGLARARTWPRPLGGDGLVETTFDIDARGTALPGDETRARAVATTAGRATAACRRGIAGSFVATAYVRPDGRVLAAGVAPPSVRGEDAADCVVDAVRKLRFRVAPGPAKASFAIR